MTAREVFRINGDGGADSPLMRTVQHLHRWFESSGVPYCVVGGLAVVRNGWVRTTYDVDVLADRSGWRQMSASIGDHHPMATADAGFAVDGDSARDRSTNVPIDILFPGDEWQMAIPLPDPVPVRELDEELGAWFIAPAPLLSLKTAVYLSKLEELGPELAAKDLTDVVELLRANRHLADSLIEAGHPVIAGELRRIWERIRDR